MISKMHQDFINNTVEVLKEDLRINGVLAGGSYITQDMDEYSDVDLVICINDSDYENVMNERQEIANKLGVLLSSFTGEHVGEPRLLICLYGPKLLHVDLKFVSMKDNSKRVEDSVILWERDNCVSKSFELEEAAFPHPSLQWIEDRLWIWVHYGATKIGRGEIFETIEFISFLRQSVIGPLTLMKNGKLPKGVRKIEFDAPDSLKKLKETIPLYSAKSCVKSLNTIIEMYLELRENFVTEDFERRSDAQIGAIEYLNEIDNKLN